MIATILHSSSSFSAVRYNELKVEHGQAELVAMKNFGAIEKRPDLASIQDKRDFLVDYKLRVIGTGLCQSMTVVGYLVEVITQS